MGASKSSLNRLTLIVILLACVACSEGAAGPSEPSEPAGSAGLSNSATEQLPALPAKILPELRSTTSKVESETVSNEALDPNDLGGVLQEAGFVTGRERRFSGRTTGFTSVVTRVLSFETAAGAAAFVDWVRAHPSSLIGKSTVDEPLALPGSPFLAVHAPDPCCPKDLPIYLSAWQRDTLVLYVRASGPGAVRSGVTKLALEMDRLV